MKNQTFRIISNSKLSEQAAAWIVRAGLTCTISYHLAGEWRFAFDNIGIGDGRELVTRFKAEPIKADLPAGTVSPAKLTTKERALLSDIVHSEYQDGNPVDHDIWLDYVIGSKSRGGVLSSLQAKGLVKIHLVPMAKSDNRQNGITDSTVCITASGFVALNAN